MPKQTSKTAIKTIFVTGASGFIGAPLCETLAQQGYTVIKATRDVKKGQQEGYVYWQPDADTLDTDKLARLAPDAVIHLAGPTIGRYWWPWYKTYLMTNRTKSATLLAKACTDGVIKPQVFIGASAIGYYGNRTSEADEAAPKGQGFAANLVARMEEALAPVHNTQTRLVNARFGIVLGQGGGALKQMLPPFKLGFGGPMGNGTQHMSWIALQDTLAALIEVLEKPVYAGVVNITSPHTVTNALFSRMLAQSINRPCLLPMPAFMVKLLFGQMGKELLLNGAPVLPKELQKNGYTFKLPHLDQALKAVL